MTWLWLILAYLAGLITPPIMRFIHGYVAGAIWQWREIRNAQSVTRVRRIDDGEGPP